MRCLDYSETVATAVLAESASAQMRWLNDSMFGNMVEGDRCKNGSAAMGGARLCMVGQVPGELALVQISDHRLRRKQKTHAYLSPYTFRLISSFPLHFSCWC